MVNNVIILMTALMPTTGHADLIRFAAHLPNARVHVLVNGRTFEPVETDMRVEALKEHFQNYGNVVVRGSIIDSAPQNPEDMPEGFWGWWRDEICSNFPEVPKWHSVVASEGYGQQVANSLDAQFLPYDIERALNPVRGTTVRSDIAGNWENIIPEMRKNYHFNAVVFGQESVGKTTISKKVAESMGAEWLLEWARPYLETVGEELSMEKMQSIHRGQAALQAATRATARTPFALYDTDLFSTVGYYRIMGQGAPEECLSFAEALSAEVYYVLPDDIPFVADPLRYGGDVRESDTEFWTGILEEFNLEYVMVPSGSVDEKVAFIEQDIRARFEQRVRDIASFERD